MTIFDVQRFSIHDGPGIRTTVFLKGCPLRCRWCQNPEGLEFGLKVDDPGPAEGFREIEPLELAEEVLADSVFFETSGGGVTFSGGEPMAQLEDVLRAAAALRARGIHTAMETSLHAPPESMRRALSAIDLFIADIKIFDSSAHERGTGFANEAILDNFRFLGESLRGTGRLIVRTPLIPGYTATEENLERIAAFISSVDRSISWELLDFNPLGSAKYAKLGRGDYEFAGILKPFSDRALEEFKAIAGKYGLNNHSTRSSPP